MAFDPSSATLIEPSKKFDPSTATEVGLQNTNQADAGMLKAINASRALSGLASVTSLDETKGESVSPIDQLQSTTFSTTMAIVKENVRRYLTPILGETDLQKAERIVHEKGAFEKAQEILPKVVVNSTSATASYTGGALQTPQMEVRGEDSPLMTGIKAAGNNIIGLIDFALSPVGLGTLELGTIAKGTGTIANAAGLTVLGAEVKFTKDLATSAVEQLQIATDPTKSANERVAAGVNATAAIIGSGMIAIHAAKGDEGAARRQEAENKMREDLKKVPTEHLEAFLQNEDFKKKWQYDTKLIEAELLERRGQQTTPETSKAAAEIVKDKPTENETPTPSQGQKEAPASKASEPVAGQGDTKTATVEQPVGDKPADSQGEIVKDKPDQLVSSPLESPAIRNEDGTISKGKDHNEILKSQGKPTIENPTEREQNPNMGFVDQQGNFLSREEAAKRAEEHGQLTTDETPEKLHSSDLQNTNEPAFAKAKRVLSDIRGNDNQSQGILSNLSSPTLRNLITSWAERVKTAMNWGKAAIEYTKGKDVRNLVSATFDAVDNKAGQLAKRWSKSVELSLGQKSGSTADKAATFVRQANGDRETMLKKLEAIRGKGFDDVIDYAIRNWDSLEKAANTAKKATDAVYAEQQANGIEFNYRDNYVKGSYHDASGKIIFDETRGLGGSSSSKNAKVFNDYAEAIAAGFVPKELSLTSLTENVIQNGLRSVERRKWAESLKSVDAPSGKPLVGEMETHPVTGDKVLPKGYTQVEISPGNFKPVEENFASTIRALTTPSLVPRFIMNAWATVKHNKLAFDFFHGFRLGQLQMGFEGKLKPSYHKGLASLEYFKDDLAEAVKQGKIKQHEADYATKNYEILDKLVSAGLNVGKVSDALYKDTARFAPGSRRVNNFIFDKLQRGIAIESGIYAFKRNQNLHPEWSEQQILRQTVKDVNTVYRNIGNQGILRNKTFQDLARILFLAPQWFEGGLKYEITGLHNLAKAGIDIPKQLLGDPKSLATKVNIGNVGKGMGTGLLAYFVGNQVINMLTTGKPTWENPDGHKLDAFILDKLEDSKGYYLPTWGVFAETSGDATTKVADGKNPLDVTTGIVKNKFHPMIGAGRDLFWGTNFYGKKLGNLERFTQAAKDIAPIPLTIGGLTSGVKGDIEKQLLSTLGVKVKPNYNKKGKKVSTKFNPNKLPK